MIKKDSETWKQIVEYASNELVKLASQLEKNIQDPVEKVRYTQGRMKQLRLILELENPEVEHEQ